MDQQTSQELTQKIQSQWQQLSPQILQRFTTVSTADIDSAIDADDLVRRISDRSHYSERYVETQLRDLVGVGAGAASTSQQKQPFGRQSPGQQS